MKFSCMKMKFCLKVFMAENSMHEVVYSPTTHDHFWGETFMLGATFSFSCMEISFSYHKNEMFMHENIKFPCMKMKVLCMKFSCMKHFVRDWLKYRVQLYSFNVIRLQKN